VIVERASGRSPSVMNATQPADTGADTAGRSFGDRGVRPRESGSAVSTDLRTYAGARGEIPA
jgi:hypothetical protein